MSSICQRGDMPEPIRFETKESIAPDARGLFRVSSRDLARRVERVPKRLALGPDEEIPQEFNRLPVPAPSKEPVNMDAGILFP